MSEFKKCGSVNVLAGNDFYVEFSPKSLELLLFSVSVPL